MYVVMEYCPKGDLQDYIKQKRRDKETFSEEECINIIDNVLRGLHQLN
jgi:serine/threonine protein kinase